MELQVINNNSVVEHLVPDLPFIEANTMPVTLQEIEQYHIIPVYNKDNHALISQQQFVNTTQDILCNAFTEGALGPFIRVSHPIKGRIPSARYKKVHELLPHEETLYYERMMFVYIVPSITKIINGKEMKLVVGGIKAYNKENLNKNKNALQQFTFFIGFQVTVCSNLCIWTDGIKTSIMVNTIDALALNISELLYNYDAEQHFYWLKHLHSYELTEEQVAHVLGKCRLYNYLPKHRKSGELFCGLNDTQLSLVARHFYHDKHFASSNRNIDLWSMYNLFTSALKSSYIDTMTENNMQVSTFFHHITNSLENRTPTWYLS